MTATDGHEAHEHLHDIHQGVMQCSCEECAYVLMGAAACIGGLGVLRCLTVAVTIDESADRKQNEL
jgi:hypothetical protein